MAVLATTHPTLLDFKTRLDDQDQVSKIIEMLSQTNEMIEDAVFLEANGMDSHTTVVRTGLPAVTWRKLYGGVQPSKSITAKVKDTIGMLEAYAEVDKALADLNGNTETFRLSEDAGFIESMNQQVAQYMIYGNEATESEAFTGLAPRFNDQVTALNAENIITDAATPDGNDNASLWLVGWGPQSVHMIYPKGSKAGLQTTDKGQVTIENVDGAGGRMEAYRTHYRWDVGMSVRDWRYVVRVQFDYENLVKDAATGPDLTDLMVQAIEMLPSTTNVRPVFYVNRGTRSWLRRQMTNKTKNSSLSLDTIAGKKVLSFDSIPVRRLDRLTTTEAGI